MDTAESRLRPDRPVKQSGNRLWDQPVVANAPLVQPAGQNADRAWGDREADLSPQRISGSGVKRALKSLLSPYFSPLRLLFEPLCGRLTCAKGHLQGAHRSLWFAPACAQGPCRP